MIRFCNLGERLEKVVQELPVPRCKSPDGGGVLLTRRMRVVSKGSRTAGPRGAVEEADARPGEGALGDRQRDRSFQEEKRCTGSRSEEGRGGRG